MKCSIKTAYIRESYWQAILNNISTSHGEISIDRDRWSLVALFSLLQTFSYYFESSSFRIYSKTSISENISFI
jgi:hypothetical protein